jgi:hemerythrin-like metal-binding protein
MPGFLAYILPDAEVTEVGDADWDTELDAGFEALDADHRLQARAVRALENAVKRGGEREVIQALLLGLIETTHAHFSAEQDLMRRWRYPAYEAHAHAHSRLLQELADLKASHSAGGLVIDADVIGSLKLWLSVHIHAMDHALAEYLKERDQREEA